MASLRCPGCFPYVQSDALTATAPLPCPIGMCAEAHTDKTAKPTSVCFVLLGTFFSSLLPLVLTSSSYCEVGFLFVGYKNAR